MGLFTVAFKAACYGSALGTEDITDEETKKMSTTSPSLRTIYGRSPRGFRCCSVHRAGCLEPSRSGIPIYTYISCHQPPSNGEFLKLILRCGLGNI
jgi:hypothetical protein